MQLQPAVRGSAMFVLNHALDLLNSPPAFLAQKYAALLRKLPQITCKSHTDHYHVCGGCWWGGGIILGVGVAGHV